MSNCVFFLLHWPLSMMCLQEGPLLCLVPIFSIYLTLKQGLYIESWHHLACDLGPENVIISGVRRLSRPPGAMPCPFQNGIWSVFVHLGDRAASLRPWWAVKESEKERLIRGNLFGTSQPFKSWTFTVNTPRRSVTSSWPRFSGLISKRFVLFYPLTMFTTPIGM